MLVEKYKPKKIKDILGQNEALRKLLLCIKEKEPVLICGPIGSGKTSSVFAIANEFDYDVIELNASDFRSKKKINETVGNALSQKSIFGKQKIILIDELEGLSGQKDRGCISEINNLIGKFQCPVVMICNKLTQQINVLKRKSTLIDFKELEPELVLLFLQKICNDEKITADSILLKQIAFNCKGDLRAALNDLNTLSLGVREREESIHNSLRLIFKSKSAMPVLNAFENVDMDLDECFLWLDENVPQEYTKESLSKAYEYLSKADIFKKRIMKDQYWRLLSYISNFLTAGIAVSKENINEKKICYQKPVRILKMWMAKQKNMEKKELAGKLASQCHCSFKKILLEMPFLEKICMYS